MLEAMLPPTRATARHLVCAIALVMAMSHSAAAQTRELGLDVFGLSWHYSSATYVDGDETRRYQSRNLGAGLHVGLGGRGRHVWMVKAGGFEDSYYQRNWYAGPVWQYRLIAGLHAGAGALLFSSPTYGPPVIPLPLVSYRAGRLGLNMTWVPPGVPEESGALAFFGTVVLWRAP